MSEKFNTITVTAKEKKKGTGVNEILVLMKNMIDFNDRLDDCIESQTNPEFTEKMKKFQACTENFYRDLSEMASQGISLVKSVEKDVTKNPELVSSIPSLGLET